MKILAISAYYHDSAAVITVDGKIIAAVCEERFTRKKHDLCFPRNSIKFCLEKSNLKIDDLDAVIFYDKPWLKFERLMLTYNMYAPRGFKSFLEVAPVWAKEKLFLKKVIKDDIMQGSYLGPEYKDYEIEQTINQFKAVAQKIENEDILIQKTSKALAEGKVVGWFSVRAEWGPRALGNRSILGDPRNPNMQMKMNLKIKYRESFRPFAPSVTEEDVKKYFEIEEKSPYMLLTSQVNKNIRFKLPKDYETFSIKDKLYYKRSELPAITHIDFSARLQTVLKETNPRYYKLIKEFEKLSKYPILINTSFNVRGKPIVLTPEDAYRCFMQTQMDILIIENYYFKKENQPEWKNQDDWKKEFVFD